MGGEVEILVRRRILRLALYPLLAAAAICAAGYVLPSDVAGVLDGVTANSLKGHVSFLASDLLEGRSTPSRGLEIAAEYIASQFRRAGLEPITGDSYFQDGAAAPPRRGPSTQAAEPIPLRNVIGVLRGSDPVLADTCVVVSAHYDHLGRKPEGEGDLIYNGANDDASGTAAVIDIAAALSRLPVRPKRTVVFIAFAGEERGLLGSRYYAAHPLFPLQKTVAGINLEQLGRTDDVTGPVVSKAYVTGFDYSDAGPLLQETGDLLGVVFARHEENNDKFFTASDNAALAQAGVPAHTVSVGFIFPDYHRPSDHWEKLDYGNMAKVVRALTAGVYRIANSAETVRWNQENPRTERFRRARETAPAVEVARP